MTTLVTVVGAEEIRRMLKDITEHAKKLCGRRDDDVQVQGIL